MGTSAKGETEVIDLRPYQAEAILSVKEDWKKYTDVLVTAATGTGKTVIFCSLLNDVLTNGKRGLILCHRFELIVQPRDRMISYFPEWKNRIGIVMGDTHEPDKQMIVATVQSLATSPRRLEDILSYGKIDYLISDECHHFLSTNSYGKVLERLRADNPEMRHLGVTATPIRADGDGLAGVYQRESYHFGIVEGIKSGYLVPVRWLAIQTKISVAGIATAGGDFVQSQLKNVYETDNCFDLVVESHKKYAGSRQAIAFTVTVEGAYKLRDKFIEAGIKAAAVDGRTNKDERRWIFSDFTAGDYQVLCNVGIATEGVDIPPISCIHGVRPTKSDGLYTQMVGRSLRLYPGKDDALILDYAPIEARNIAMMGDILGVPLRKDAYVQPEKEEGEACAGFLFDGSKFQYLKGNPADIISRQLDYLDLSPWKWYRAADGWMSLGLGEASDGFERTLVVTPPKDGLLTLYGCKREIESIDGSDRKRRGEWITYRIKTAEWNSLAEIAESFANKYGNAALAAKNRSWRKQPPSDGQIKYARTIKGAYKPGMKRGELAASITHHIARREVEHGSVVDLAWIK